MQIIPAILTDDLAEFQSLEKEARGMVNRIQIDVIDNKFAPNTTIDPLTLKNLIANLNLDFHLMVKDPVEWISHCILQKENRIIGQIEFMPSQANFVHSVISAGCLPGLAVDLPTSLAKLDQEILPQVAVVLLMSVPAGWDHQQFSLDVWAKIEKLVKLRSELGLNFKICIDGGVTRELVTHMAEEGVDEVAVGKRIFTQSLKENLHLFLEGNTHG